jgi:DNA-binding CsgD family transcriptional regulator
MGRTNIAIEAADRGHAAHLALTSDIGWHPWLHLYLRGLALADGGRLDEAESLATQQYDKALQDGSAEAQAFFDIVLGRVATDRGQMKTAARRLAEASAHFHKVGQAQVLYFTLGYLALALALGNRPLEASDTLAKLDALGLPPSYYQGVDLLIARGWTAAASGDLRTAHDTFHQAATDGETIGDILGATAALHGLARTGSPRRALARLRALVTGSDAKAWGLRLDHTQALVDQDPRALNHVAQEFHQMGMHLLSAEASADAAVAWRQAGDLRNAAAAEVLADSRAEMCQGAGTPALHTNRSRVRLTRAEREVALMAAVGRSNKSIADALCVSVRTVENHLHHVYQKLHIARRRDLADAFGMS